jgi:hypothetical protein
VPVEPQFIMRGYARVIGLRRELADFSERLSVLSFDHSSAPSVQVARSALKPFGPLRDHVVFGP